MNIRINKAHYPVRSLGPGKRIGIWFQGCSIHCKGCVSLDTWRADERKSIAVDELLRWCKSKVSQGVDGITISGGEPFDQPDALLTLLGGLNQLRMEKEIELDILCYSGFPLSSIMRNFPEALELLDAIISEPFRIDLPTRKYLCGSENQILSALTDLGRSRYELAANSSSSLNSMDFCVSGEAVWFVGIPRNDDLAKLKSAVESRGVRLGKLSWRE